jgi:hypothetical protein
VRFFAIERLIKFERASHTSAYRSFSSVRMLALRLAQTEAATPLLVTSV